MDRAADVINDKLRDLMGSPPAKDPPSSYDPDDIDDDDAGESWKDGVVEPFKP